MNGSASGSGIDRELLHGWLAARSVARGVPAPIADHGGWRVDPRSDTEWCRYVFAAADCAIADLARSIRVPRVFLKLCADEAALAALLPAGWEMGACSWFMTADSTATKSSLPPGYASTVERVGGAIRVAIMASDGALAASGYGVEAEGVFAYDRIVTNPDHQRRGLGRATMALLGSRRRNASRQVLVATDPGRALYETLGWRVLSPYSTAFIRDPAAQSLDA